MKYGDSAGSLDTAKKILKVNHAGEFGAINIYRSQIVVSRLLQRSYVPMLESFMADEKRHMASFWAEISDATVSSARAIGSVARADGPWAFCQHCSANAALWHALGP